MTDQDRSPFVDLIGSLCEVFGKPATDAKLEGYWLALRDLEIDAVNDAIGACLRECRFMPPPAEIRAKCEPDSAQIAALAWERVVDAIRQHGYWASVRFEDRAIVPAVRMIGGWHRITSAEPEQLHTWIRKEFLAAYEPNRGTTDCLRGGGNDDTVLISCPYLPANGTVLLDEPHAEHKAATRKATYEYLRRRGSGA